ncbi:hypothetical protein [Streptomyces albicerus]|uniref:hypothetical protein n=1 Tax=Streptomyces albicerus TaxID=2569859 RepID=UPI00124B61D4|nr:hypothetical protein [Streptomyces albicerus]
MSGHGAVAGDGELGAGVAFGLLAAWAVHDLEPARPRDVVQGLALAAAATVGTHMAARRLLRRG